MKKFLIALFFISFTGLFLDVACLDSNPVPNNKDYFVFTIIAIVLLVVAFVSAYGAGITTLPEKEKAPQATSNSLESKENHSIKLYR